MKGLNVYFLQAIVSCSTSSQIPLFRYFLVSKTFGPLYGKIIPLQIIIDEEFKLTILLVGIHPKQSGVAAAAPA